MIVKSSELVTDNCDDWVTWSNTDGQGPMVSREHWALGNVSLSVTTMEASGTDICHPFTCNYPIKSNSIIKILSHDMTMVSLWYWVMSLCLSLHFSHRALVFSTHFTFTRLNMTWPCNYWIMSLCFSLALDICHILQAIVRSEPIISFGDSSGSGCCHYTGPNVFTVSGARLNWEESLVPVESWPRPRPDDYTMTMNKSSLTPCWAGDDGF